MQKNVYEFISKQTNDPIVERKTCEVSGEEFAIFQSDVEYYRNISPVINGEKFQVPFPKLSPEERNIRRIAFRNDSKLYRRKCDLTGKLFISMYSQDKEFPVYSQDARYGDDWDPTDYSLDIDLEQSFFFQFNSLLKKVPRLGIQLKNCENSDYCGVAIYAKNCYLSNVCSRSEDSYYSDRIVHSKNCIDCYRCMFLENSYQSVLCSRSSKLFYCSQVSNSHNCKFSFGLDGCENCFMCYNLVNKKYYIRNKQYTKEEYQKIIGEINFCNKNTLQQLKKEFDDVMNYYAIHQSNYITNSVDSFGAFLVSCKNCRSCFDMIDSEDCKYYFDNGKNGVYCMDCSYGGDAQKCFESLSVVGYNNLFTTFCWESKNLLYCDMCLDCDSCFGCIGLRNKKYCIFNKQYTKEDYYQNIEKILKKMQKDGEWGEFFPINISPFGYNETVAMEYSRSTKQEAFERGYKWMDKEYPVNIPDDIEFIKSENLPYAIEEVTDNILTKAIICEVSQKPYRIIKGELDFYRRNKLPLPRKHQNVRYLERSKRRPGRELHLRQCDKTGETMISIYPVETNFKVYSEDIYNKAIYG